MSFPTCDQNGSLICLSANAEASASIALDQLAPGWNGRGNIERNGLRNLFGASLRIDCVVILTSQGTPTVNVQVHKHGNR